MCSYIDDAHFDDIDFQEPDWYMKHTWNRDQEKDFCIWLTEYLFKNKEAQESLYSRKNMSKEECRQTASAFCCSFGWRGQTSIEMNNN